jgi:hypothetical protein
MMRMRMTCAVLGAVLWLGSVSNARAEEAPAAKAEEAPSRHGSVFIDPLGFALFGPRIGVEAGANHVTGALYGRWFSPGLLSHQLFLNEGDSFGFSYGAGLRGRYYFGEGLSGAHVGVAAELLHTRIENQAGHVVTTQNYFVPYVEGGYRLAFGSFYGDLSAGLGYAAQLSAKSENFAGGDPSRSFAPTDESSVYGTASLEIGVFF